ncbi:MAG TPA: helix-turn-helix domain-containing protein [Candidatus Binataceae bacterium]|nr:helix-turn-helix domain-containing protein [Candidatus Binataceae bacterium]
MRVSKEEANQNRRRLLRAAAQLFRENGIEGTGVDAITERAGMTHGSLYSQFGSKNAVAAEAILYASAGSRRKWERGAEGAGGKLTVGGIVKQYLSQSHRDAPGHGCVLAALGPDVSRQPRSTRHAFTRALEGAVNLIAGLMPEREAARREDKALAVFSTMVGALILARAVDDQTLSDRILRTSAACVTNLAANSKEY